MACLRLLLALTAIPLLGTPPPSFRIFTTQDGLVRNWVTKIHRDSQGYLWFCTVEGVSLFDGYQFTNFSTADGLPSRLVLDMLETTNGDLWFATEAGLAKFHRNHKNNRAFDTFRIGDSAESNIVEVLYQGYDGTIWCGTSAGLYTFRPNDIPLHPNLVPLNGFPPSEVRALAEDSHRNLWVGVSNALVRRRPNGEITSIRTTLIPLPAQRINSLLVDADDRLWIGGYGLAGIDAKAEPPRMLPPQDIPKTTGEISVLYLGDHGEVWVGGSAGLMRFYPDAASRDSLVYKPSEAFPVQQTGSIALDVRHNLWAGIGTRGVVRIAPGSTESFSRDDGLESAEIHGVVEGLHGTVYALTGQWTLNEFRSGRFAPIPLRLPAHSFTWGLGQTVVQDRDGAWWAASGVGVARYRIGANARDLKGKSPERIYSVRDGLPSPIVLRVFQDSRGGIWAGTADGVGYLSCKTGKWKAFQTADLVPGSSATAAVHSFAEDSSGNVWAGLFPNGLVRFRGLSHELLTHSVPQGAINSLLSDSQGRLWIGSSQGGVGRMDNPAAPQPEISRYGLPQGLSSEHVFSLAEDKAGRIYVAGGRGVDRLDPKATTVRHFNPSNGLPPGETQFLFRDHEGDIWFSSFYGLVRYRPEPDRVSEAPTPLFRALRLGDVPYPIAETGEQVVTGQNLKSGHNGLDIEFRALHFDIGEGLRYQYRLEDSDTEWSEPSYEREVHYVGLAPGNYRFSVRSVTESGQISRGQATLTFQVLPVFWRRTWFLSLMLLAILSAAVYFHRYRLNHLLTLERMRTRLATDLHDDLGAGLAEIAILSEVAKRQERMATTASLHTIASRARALREALSDIVWTVDPRDNNLTDLVQHLREVAFTMIENEERTLEFIAQGDQQIEIELLPDVRRHLLLFFKEAVTNVVRHSGATAVRVELTAARGCLRLFIRDNGCGFDPQQPHVGRGLKGLQYRALELDAGFRLHSIPQVGSEIELTLVL